MKGNRLIELAQKIAKYETILDNPSSNIEDKAEAQEQIVHLTMQTSSFEDLIILDEMIQDILRH